MSLIPKRLALNILNMSYRNFGRDRRERRFRSFHNKYEEGASGSNEPELSESNPSAHRHPPHLRGRDIGLFYARKNRGRTRKPLKLEKSDVLLDSQKEEQLNSMLSVISNNKTTGEESAVSEERNNFLETYNSFLDESKLRNEGVEEVYQPEVDGLQTNAELDKKFLRELEEMERSPQYQKMQVFRRKLPSYGMQKQIVKLIEDNQVVVLSGETGCGKTTQVSQFILDSYIKAGQGSTCRIICTQPRRISAITVAERVAEERAEKCGENSSVGWQIRLEKKPARTLGSILYCTTGVLLQWLKGDSFLTSISHIILDEIHERDLDSDFLMIILKDLLKQRPDLKLVLMSATLNANLFSKYFGACPMINIPGFTYPVKEYLLEDVLEMTGYVPENTASNWRHKYKKGETVEKDPEPFYRSLVGKYSRRTIDILRNWDEFGINLDLIATLLRHINKNEKNGAVLIFLPGWSEISKLNTLLESSNYFNNGSFLILPLHSMMPTINQREIFNPPPPGVRKVILATNIAETSITIDDVVYVIDCGKIKMSKFDVDNNIETLNAEWVSLANSRQRRGRAGRVAPGICYHLYTKFKEMTLDQYILPELLRTRLETLCLKIKILKLGAISPFLEKAMNQPDPKSVAISIERLKKVNALTDEESLTPLGFHLARLPMDPLTGRMILFGAIFSCLDPILTIAASLSFKDAFLIPLGKEKQVDERRKLLAGETRSDHLMLATAFAQWEEACKVGEDRRYCWDNFLSPNTLKMLSSLKTQFAEYLKDLHFLPNADCKNPTFNKYSNNEMVLKAVICAGLYPNVSRLKKKINMGKRPPVLYTDQIGKVGFHPKSINSNEKLFPSEWVVYYQKIKSTSIFLHDTTMVHPYALLFFGGKLTTGVDDNKKDIVSVDDFIVFNCSQHIASIVMKLRKELDKLLQYKIEHPEDNEWIYNESSKESLVMKSIIDLLMTEDNLTSLDQMSMEMNRNYKKKYR